MSKLSVTEYPDPPRSGKPYSAALRRIAYATSLNESRDNALHWAIQTAKASDADLVLLHILPPPVPLFEAEPFEKREAQITLSVRLAQVRATGVRTTALLLSGTDSIGKQISRAASLEKVDLIVIGTRNRSRTFRFFIGGSVAASVVAHAECPVLVIPSNHVYTGLPVAHG
jgi:nucleotide-binding universal stress UspA family protein